MIPNTAPLGSLRTLVQLHGQLRVGGRVISLGTWGLRSRAQWRRLQEGEVQGLNSGLEDGRTH